MSPLSNPLSDFINTDFLYQHSSCGQLSFDVNGKIHSVNDTFLQWTGLERSACLNSGFTDLLTTGGVLYYQMVVNSLLHLHGLANEINFTFKSIHGNFEALFDAVAYKNESGQVLMINATVLKITDRKKYETELLIARHEAEEDKRKIEFLLNGLPVMIWTIKPDGRVNYINQRVKEYIGESSPEALSGFMGVIDEDREEIISAWHNCLQTGEKLDKEIRVIRENSTYEWCMLKMEPYRNGEGQIELWYGSCTSIHNRKTLELANQSALTNHLSTAHQTIEQNKDQFNRIAFNHVHMIRKPVANIMGLIPLLKSEPISAEGKLVLELLLMSTTDLDSLIRDIVAQTKI